MHNIVAKSEKEIEQYRDKIFKSKDEYRKKLMKLPFEKKIEILLKLQQRRDFFKKLKQ